MPFTQTQIEALEAAIAQGVLTVKYQDRTVTYRSLTEMMQILTTMQESLGLTSNKIRVNQAYFDKGL